MRRQCLFRIGQKGKLLAACDSVMGRVKVIFYECLQVLYEHMTATSHVRRPL